MNIITIDFETYYSTTYSLTKMSTEAYIRSDLFQVIGFSYKVNDGVTQWVTGTRNDIEEAIKKLSWDNSLVLCHNTMFDGAILSWRYGVKPKGWLDTLSMGRALHGINAGGSLKAMAERYRIGVKGTEVLNALGKRRLDFTPEELARYGEYCNNDVELTYKLFNKMMEAGFPKSELKLIDLTLSMFIHPVLELDQNILQKHLEETVRAKSEHLSSALQAIGRTDLAAANIVGDTSIKDEIRAELMSNQKFAEMLKGLGVEPPMKISPATGKSTFAFAKTDEAFKALLEHDDVRVQALCAARLGTKSTLEETRTQRFIDIGKRGLLPVPLKYYGAKTGRWAASDSINMQNIPRGSTLKKAILAPEGYVLIGADLSNIELRVGLWLAGQLDKLSLLGKGHDLYKDFASSVFNVPYEAVNKEQRFIGKTSQLSLIYGVGAKKLRAAVLSGSGTDIGEEESQRIVSLYRTDYSKVAHTWREGEMVLRAVSRDQSMEFGTNGLIKVHGKKGCLLPSGLYMMYPDLQQVMQDGKAKWCCKTRNGTEFTYGAKVFQGLTQAIARCIMAESMLRVAKKYTVALTVHDAEYVLALEKEAEAVMAFVIHEMCVPPKWMPDIPLDAEGSYGKSLADC